MRFCRSEKRRHAGSWAEWFLKRAQERYSRRRNGDDAQGNEGGAMQEMNEAAQAHQGRAQVHRASIRSAVPR
jgi:hypothetical protein